MAAGGRRGHAASPEAFAREAERILAIGIAHRVGRLGGYGPGGEVIYEAHPAGCPSTLVAVAAGGRATFMSNGSVAFEVEPPDAGMTVSVLDGSFDATAKRETGVLSSNVWIELPPGKGTGRRAASLIAPRFNISCEPERIRVVKTGDPDRAMWYCARFSPARGLAFETAVRLSLYPAAAGPVLLRETFVRNAGSWRLEGRLWTYFNLHGTQRFVYNKDLWYDAGMPAGPGLIVVAASVPYSDMVQIKAVSSAAGAGLRPAGDTCDYAAFVGDSASSAAMPAAVRMGRFLPGAGARLNRFSIPTVAASAFDMRIPPGRSAALVQSLLYVTDPELAAEFRGASACDSPDYRAVEKRFRTAASALVRKLPGAARLSADARKAAAASGPPAFSIGFPREPLVSEYARSVWTGVAELYEHCRAHGARLAQGIELGTRDRAQDMWPKMKEDPGRVRADLLHALSFMYVTVDDGHRWSSPMSRAEKLHGMFPRQYPSRWDDRSVPVRNDNRPYADSAVWLLDALNMYVRETGDAGILAETVGSVRLTDPSSPETSAITGCDRRQTVAETAVGILECYFRHAADSPYGLAQIMYGDWCDPVDMFGTSRVGDPSTRGEGRGAQVRLSAHVFNAAVSTVDLLESPAARRAAGTEGLAGRIERIKEAANRLRKAIIRVGWEPGPRGRPGAFLAAIHELGRDNSRPDYPDGGTGYTLGSLLGRDFDGIPRRELLAQAHCIPMLMTSRIWLDPVPDAGGMIRDMLATADSFLYDEELGLRLFHPPIANCEASRKLVGRMGVLPAGCAENGEYHHGQIQMHLFRLSLPGQEDTVWKQFKRMISAFRDESLAGPFEMPCTSYASDRNDPHFGKGMYFGLSGSTDWIIEFFQAVAGVRLNLLGDGPALKIEPRLPRALGCELSFRRTVHLYGDGRYRRIPLSLEIRRAVPGIADRAGGGEAGAGREEGRAARNRRGAGIPARDGRAAGAIAGDPGRRAEKAARDPAEAGEPPAPIRVTINGREVERAEVASLDGIERLDIRIEFGAERDGPPA